MEQQKPTSKRLLILDAALQCFCQKGYYNTRMEDIAVLAGIGKGTIYEYFPSKLKLFQEMFSRSLQIYYQNQNSMLDQDKPFAQRLELLLASHFQFCQENQELARVIFWDTEIIDEELKEWTYQMRKDKETQLQELVAAAVSSGELRNLDPYLVTIMLIGILEGIWAPVIIEGWEFDSKKLAREVTDIILHGLQPPTSPNGVRP